MTKLEYFKLIDKYNEGLASAEEERLLNAYYNLYSLKDDGLQNLTAEQRVQLAESIKKDIDQRNLADVGVEKRFKLWPRIAVAASVLLTISVGMWLYKSVQPLVDQSSKVVVQNDILPGKNMAVLTLANGKSIDLSDAKAGVVIDPSKLTYNDGTAIPGKHLEGGSESAMSAQMLMMSTPRGGHYQVVLSDGTKVWMNADSKIRFPSRFYGKNRKIWLEGEAYFEVQKDKIHSFIVESKGQQVEVLGTHFNINAYADEKAILTTLVEGAVRVAPLIKKGKDAEALYGRGITIEPGEQTENKDGDLSTRRVNAEDVVSWKTGKFSFDGEEMSSIMRKVERWYNVRVIFKDDASHVKLTGSISRFENVSKLLQMLENTKEVGFKLEGRTIIVTKL